MNHLEKDTDSLKNPKLINQLVNDYQHHRGQDVYIRYMNQLTNANSNTKGESPMFEEMMERAKMEAETYYTTLYTTLLGTLNDKIEHLSSSNEQLSSQVDYLKNLLKQNNIQFD